MPGGQLADETGPQQQLVAGGLGLGGSLAQGLAEKLRHSHGTPPKNKPSGQLSVQRAAAVQGDLHPIASLETESPVWRARGGSGVHLVIHMGGSLPKVKNLSRARGTLLKSKPP